jgi:hypothetical protein
MFRFDSNIIENTMGSFVRIALTEDGSLRNVSVEALRVFSEDINPQRGTRFKLCELGAAKALGLTLYGNIDGKGELFEMLDDIKSSYFFKEVFEAVCGLANIFDPLPELSREPALHQVSCFEGDDARTLLIKGCTETSSSGGLDTLLFIVSSARLRDALVNLKIMELLIETCRSLACISPFLLSEGIAANGYAWWAVRVLDALHILSKEISNCVDADNIGRAARELQVNLMRGLAALAKSEPLKVKMIEKVFPFILQAYSLRDGTDTSSYATQAFQSLGFSDDEVAVQVAGNSPQLLADWFCLKRSCLIQAMARQEVRKQVRETWSNSFEATVTNVPGMTSLYRVVSEASKSEDSNFSGSTSGIDLFENFADDGRTASLRASMIQEYRDVYGRGGAPDDSVFLALRIDRLETKLVDNLLSRQVYPLNSSDAETEWILEHDKALRELPQENLLASYRTLPHVENLLNCCFPSTLLRNHILPINSLSPTSSFNFRALMMPQKRYFSFRREGQLIARLCAAEADICEASDIHWTLGFTNSNFSGDFAESLVRALYLCPMVQGLTFSNDNDMCLVPDGDEEIASEGGTLLANLVGTLPPGISAVTFDGILADQDLKSLVNILVTISTLSTTQHEIHPRARGHSTTKSWGQGSFWFFAIRRSPAIKEATWDSFFSLIGNPTRSPKLAPLASLKILDLSGNLLGDALCARILGLIHDKDSGCSIEQLDLSGNQILAGKSVLRVLQGYKDHHRMGQWAGRSSFKDWRSPLRVLYLASNGLHVGQAWVEIVGMLKNNAVDLSVLDLSYNQLTLDENDWSFDLLMLALLNNTSLYNLNLSGNKFSSFSIDRILTELTAATNDSPLAFLLLDKNSPALTLPQRSQLETLSSRSRKVLLQRFFRSEVNEPSASDSNFSASEFFANEDEDQGQVQKYGNSLENTITVLFSAPLVYSDESNILWPFAKLDFSHERTIIWQSLKEASRDIELTFDTADKDRFLSAISKRCSCLHYSGHGHQQYLPFEDKGGPHWFSVTDIQQLVASQDGASFRFVFVSACHSENAGRTFVAAGVPHVVCCRQDSELKDAAALAFTQHFYLALAVGNTVRKSFDLGCKAVRVAPQLRNAESEMEKFKLLPEDGNHDKPIFDAKPICEWPRTVQDKTMNLGRGKSKRSLYSGTSELTVKNMIQEDPAPTIHESFMGREVEMYQLLRKVLENRLVNVIGEVGIGRSSLVCALCHYINERASTMLVITHIYFIQVKHGRKDKRAKELVRRLLQKLVDNDRLLDMPDLDTDIETMSEIACRTLKNDKALIVFDRIDLLENADEANEFELIILSNLLRETRNTKILLTNKRPLGNPSIGEVRIELGPLNFENTVKLFASRCPYVGEVKEKKNKLIKAIITDADEKHVFPTDPLPASTRRIFSMLGDGVPAKIHLAAYNLSKEHFFTLMSGSLRDES